MNTTFLHIIPECFVDTNLVQIVMHIKGVNHQKGTGAVTRKMQTAFKDAFAVAIIDLDKEQSAYARESQEIAHSRELTLCKHPDSSHYIIKVNNIMEMFILHCAEELDIELSDYGIPSDLEGLKLVTKSKDSLDNPQLRLALKVVSEASEMRLLRNVLQYLNEKRYDSKEYELRAIFAQFGF